MVYFRSSNENVKIHVAQLKPFRVGEKFDWQPKNSWDEDEIDECFTEEIQLKDIVCSDDTMPKRDYTLKNL